MKNARSDRNNTGGYSYDFGDFIQSLLFCAKESSENPIPQLVGKFGNDCGLYHLPQATDKDGFKKYLCYKVKVEWVNKMTPTFF